MGKIYTQAEIDAATLPADVDAYLKAGNPWWYGGEMAFPPPYRRWLFEAALGRLKDGPAPITVLRGPRQVGKTTLQEQVIRYLLEEEDTDPLRIFRIQFDELPPFQGELPVFKLCLWFQYHILGGTTFNELSNRGKPVYLVFDEVQNLDNWAPQLKSLVDHNAVRVLVTGSSAFRIEAGRDSLAGRISTLEMGTLLLREIAALRDFGEIEPAMRLNGILQLREREFWEELRERGRRYREIRDRAFAVYAERGGYPVAHIEPERSWETLADQLNETVIRRVLKHDIKLREGESADLRVLEQVVRTACHYAGQDPGAKIFLPALRKELELDLDWLSVVSYLQALDDSLLIRRIPPRSLRLQRQEHRYKLCLCDHFLRASWLGEKIPLVPGELGAGDPVGSRLAGPLAESIAGYFLSTIPGLDVAWIPGRGDARPEIDLVLTVGYNYVPIEVKYRQRIDPRRDPAALLSFIEDDANRAPFGVLITLHDEVEIPDPRIVALPLSSLLLLR